ncbi:MAG: helix-turn-helix transcriptional regulator [Verrucomicrobia bacterium]|nr:helix-turn-helix transcriptional regulator [Verrucomicrobiota bacterium]
MPKIKQNAVGPSVRRHRMAAAWSQEALAVKLQVAGWDLSRAGLSKIEAGLRRVTDAETWLLAKVLDCRIDDLFPTDGKSVMDVMRQARG